VVVVVVVLLLVDVLVDVDVEVLVLVLVELLLVVVVVGGAVVLVVVDVLLLVVVVVIKFIDISIKFVHTPVDTTLIVTVPSGTTVDVYPAIKVEADIFVANATVYPSVLEKRLKGPAFPSIGKTNVINAIIIYLYIINEE
jgi:hypothetical protein